MKIIEQNVVGKSLTAETEDGIVVTDRFVAVIDGSTSKTPRHIQPGISNGRFCMMLIAEYIRSNRDVATCEDFCHGITEFVKTHYHGTVIERLATHPEERLTASCIVYSCACREIWMVGDCQCLVDGRSFDNPKPCEQVIAEKRADIAAKLIASGKASVDSLRENDIARSAILPELVRSMAGQNKDYAVVDGFPIPMGKVRRIAVPQNAHNVVLASDGYPELHPTLQESEEALSLQLQSDPLNIRYFKATKAFVVGNNSFDDRAYIRFEP